MMANNNGVTAVYDGPSFEAELIGFGNTWRIIHKGFCNVEIERSKKSIKVSPCSSEYKPFTAILKQLGWNYYVKNNCIFVFAGAKENQDFVLVFRDSKCCKDVYDILFPPKDEPADAENGKKKKKSGIKDVTHEFHRRFLIPICVEINKVKDEKLIRVLQEWLSYFKEKATETYMEFTKKQKVFHLVYPNEYEKDPDKKAYEKQLHSDTGSDSDVKATPSSKKSKPQSKENQKDGKKRVSLSRKQQHSDNDDDSDAETSTAAKNKSKTHSNKSPKNVKQRSRKQQSSGDEDSSGKENEKQSKRPENKTAKNVKQRAQKNSNSDDDSGDENSVAQNKSKDRSRRNQKDVKQQARKKKLSDDDEDSDSDEPKSRSKKSPKKAKLLVRTEESSDSDQDSGNESSSVQKKSSKRRPDKEASVTPAKKKKLSKDRDNKKKGVSFAADDESDNETDTPVCTALTPVLKAAKRIGNSAKRQTQSEDDESQSQSSDNPDKLLAKVNNMFNASTSSTPKSKQPSSSKKINSKKLLGTDKFADKDIEEDGFRLELDTERGISGGILLVFHPNNRNRCYEYYLDESLHIHVCRKCPNVTANVQSRKNGERYCTLGKHEHSCRAVSY